MFVVHLSVRGRGCCWGIESKGRVASFLMRNEHCHTKQAGKSLLKNEYAEGCDLETGLKLGAKVKKKRMDGQSLCMSFF